MLVKDKAVDDIAVKEPEMMALLKAQGIDTVQISQMIDS